MADISSLSISNIPSKLLTVPPDLLIEKILTLLTFNSLAACTLTCHALHDLIRSSQLLTYRQELEFAGLIDNPRASYDEYPAKVRLEMLRDRERRWKTLDWQRRTTVRIPKMSLRGYDCAPTTHLLGGLKDPQDPTSYSIYSASLFDKPSEDVIWEEIFIGKDVIDFAPAIEEHDLVAFVTFSDDRVVEVQLTQLSTKRPHAGAISPVLDLGTPEANLGRPTTSVAICGNNLVVALMYKNAVGSEGFNDTLQIWDWKRGVRKGDPITIFSDGFLFLREDLLAKTNIWRKSLEIYQIPAFAEFKNGHTVKRIETILFPALTQMQFVTTFECRVDTNSTSFFSLPGHNPSNLPFLNDPLESICLFNLDILNMETRESLSSFSVVTHRKTLLDLALRAVEIKKSAVASESQDDNPLEINWEEWGPQGTRWFPLGETMMQRNGLITTVSGSRWVARVKGVEEDSPAIVNVFDFGRRRVAHERWERKNNPNLSKSYRLFDTDFFWTLDAREGIFNDDVISTLPLLNTQLSLKPLANVRNEDVEVPNEKRWTVVAINEHSVMDIRFGAGEYDVVHLG